MQKSRRRFEYLTSIFRKVADKLLNTLFAQSIFQIHSSSSHFLWSHFTIIISVQIIQLSLNIFKTEVNESYKYHHEGTYNQGEKDYKDGGHARYQIENHSHVPVKYSPMITNFCINIINFFLEVLEHGIDLEFKLSET